MSSNEKPKQSKPQATFKSSYPSFPSNKGNFPTLAGEGVFWEFPQYEGIQRQYANNGIFLGNPNLYYYK